MAFTNTTPTPQQIDVFKAAWEKADAEGRVGERVYDGLQAVFEMGDPDALFDKLPIGTYVVSPSIGSTGTVHDDALIYQKRPNRFWIIRGTAVTPQAAEAEARGLFKSVGLTRVELRPVANQEV